MTECKHRWHFTEAGKKKSGMYVLHCLRCYQARMAQLTSAD